ARTLESNGQGENAIAAYGRVRSAYAKSPAADKAAVPLALLLEKSPQSVARARRVLAEFVDSPEAAARAPDEFRAALFELASLCYSSGDINEATSRLEKFVGQFPRD